MSEFKWVPEVGDKFTHGKLRGMILEENQYIHQKNSDRSYATMGGWNFGIPKDLQPRGKRTKAKYAKAKKEWEDAQVIGVGDWVERITKDNSSVKVGDILKCIESAFGFICVNNESPDECHFAEYFRKLTPAEALAHEASLVPEFEVGSYWVLLDDEGYHIKKNSFVEITATANKHGDVQVQDLSQQTYRDGLWYTAITNLRPATAEEIKAATRTVHDLEKGDICFVLYPGGDVTHLTWEDSDFEKRLIQRGNAFLTREEAEAEDARRVAANREVAA